MGVATALPQEQHSVRGREVPCTTRIGKARVIDAKGLETEPELASACQLNRVAAQRGPGASFPHQPGAPAAAAASWW